jgi:hypothetical protein
MPNWRKVITSGSDASLSSLTTTGNISGSATSTGSFGSLVVADKVQGPLEILETGDSPALKVVNSTATAEGILINNTADGGNSNTRYFLKTERYNGGIPFIITNGGRVGVSTDSPSYSVDMHVGEDNFRIYNTAADIGLFISPQSLNIATTNGSPYDFTIKTTNSGTHGSNGGQIIFKPQDTTLLTLDRNLISGSSTSTGSFGQLTLPQEDNPANPTLNFGDGDTGLFSSQNNYLSFATNGSTKFYLTSNTAVIGGNGSGNSSYELQFHNSAVKVTRSSNQLVLGGYEGYIGFYDTLSTVTRHSMYKDRFRIGNGSIPSSGEVLQVHGNAYITGSVIADGNISGSTSSTGSFGHLVIAKDAHIGEDVLADGDVVAYNSSDIRLKDNIQVIKGSLDKIGDIRGVEFDWNDKSPGWARERGHDVGVIAQEVQKVVPEIVVERKSGYLGVDYKRLIPLLVESIKELKQEVENLKKKVN